MQPESARLQDVELLLVNRHRAFVSVAVRPRVFEQDLLRVRVRVLH